MEFKVHHAQKKRSYLASSLLNLGAIVFGHFICMAYYFAVPWTFVVIPVALYYRTFWLLVVAAVTVFSWVCPVWPSESISASLPFKCLAHYFDVEYYQAESEGHYNKSHNGRNILYLTFPHGIISFGGLSAGTIPGVSKFGTTAVADVVLALPVLRSIFGWLNCISSSKKSMMRQLTQRGNCVLYPGGIAELFLSSPDEEHLYFKKRLGCIKLALQANADIVPCYFVGNTSTFSIVKDNRLISYISRKLRMTLSLFWGRWGLPIPRQHKIILGVGPRIELPKIDNPEKDVTDELIQEFHQKALEGCQTLYDSLRVKHPLYKDKELHFH